jgi:hypothetical protein
MRRLFYPIPDGIKLQHKFYHIAGFSGNAEVISVTLLIGSNVAFNIACNLSSTYLYIKMENHTDKVAGLMIRKKGTKNNPNDIAQALLEEIERLEKDKE